MRVVMRWSLVALLLMTGLSGAFATGDSETRGSAASGLAGTVKVQLIGGFAFDDTTDAISGAKVIGVHYLKEAFEKLYPNVKVEFVLMGWDSYTEKTQAMLRADEADVVQVPGIALLADQGLLAPLQPFIDRDKFKLSIYADNQVLGWQAMGPNDTKLQVYGLPFIADTRFIAYDKVLFDQWKVPYLTGAPTLDELREKAVKMTGKNPVTGQQNYGFMYNGSDVADMAVNITEALGGRWGTGFRWREMKTEFNSPQMVQAVTWLKDITAYCPPGVISRQGGEKWLTLDNNLAIVVQNGPGILKTIQALGLQDRIGISRQFINEKERMGYLFAGSPVGIGVNSKVKDLAWEWIKFTASDTVQQYMWDQYRSLPTIKSALKWKSMEAIPQLKPVLETVGFLWAPRYPYRAGQPRYILTNAVQGAILGKQAVQDAMNQAQAETEAWLKAQ